MTTLNDSPAATATRSSPENHLPVGTDDAPGIDSGHQEGSALKSPRRQKRLWVLALGGAAVWQMDPALREMAEMIGVIACADNKALARDAITQMREKADRLRAGIAPLQASALVKVVRRAEAACGAVLDKGARIKDLQTSWEHLLACVRARRETETSAHAQDQAGSGG